MVMLSLTFAMLYGPWQLWVLATPTPPVVPSVPQFNHVVHFSFIRGHS